MKNIFLLIFTILFCLNANAQMNEFLWEHYLYENQLSEARVKTVIVKGIDIKIYTLLINGKIENIRYSNLNGKYLGKDEFLYFGKNLMNINGYREKDIYFATVFEYLNMKPVEAKKFVNRFYSNTTYYDIDIDGWITFILKTRRIGNTLEHKETSRKKIHYYKNGLITSIETYRGENYFQTIFHYNQTDNYNELFKFEHNIYVDDNKNPEVRVGNIINYENGLPKEIEFDGFIQYLSYTFYSENEFIDAKGNLDLLNNKITDLNNLRKSLEIRLKNLENQYLLRDIKYELNSFRSKITNQTDFNKKNELIQQAKTKIASYQSMSDKKLKRLNTKKAPYN